MLYYYSFCKYFKFNFILIFSVFTSFLFFHLILLYVFCHFFNKVKNNNIKMTKTQKIIKTLTRMKVKTFLFNSLIFITLLNFSFLTKEIEMLLWELAEIKLVIYIYIYIYYFS